jgi:sortase A
MMMDRRIRRFLGYILYPIIIVALGYLTIYVAGLPVLRLVSAVSGMVITKSAPTFSEELDSIFQEHKGELTEYVDQSEITVPLYQTQYAKITCDRIELLAPIYWGDSDKVLKLGVGQYIGSFMPGYGRPILLSAHDSTYFAPLEEVKEGDIIEVSTSYGDYEYQVTGMKVTTASDASAYDLMQSKEQLILYTCYPFGAVIGIKDQRYFVYADKLQGPEIIQGGEVDARAD